MDKTVYVYYIEVGQQFHNKEDAMNRKPYPTDLTTEQYEIIDSVIPYPNPRCRPYEWPIIEILNAILYVVRSGCVHGGCCHMIFLLGKQFILALRVEKERHMGKDTRRFSCKSSDK